MAERSRPALRSVRVRITLAAVLVTAVAVSLAGWLLVRSVEDTQLADLRRRTEDRVEEIGEALERGIDPREAVTAGPADTFVEVVDANGYFVAAGPLIRVDGSTSVVSLGEGAAVRGEPAADCVAVPDLAAAEPGPCSGTPGGSGEASDPGEAGGALVRQHRLDIVETGAVSRYPMEMVAREVDTASGPLTVRAAAPVDEVRRSVGAVRRALVVGLPGLVLLVAGVAWTLVGRALRPVEGIRSEVEAITGSTIHRRVPEPEADDEIGRLARTMNAMLGRLEAAQVRQRQFVSDASHELRSPVAAIRSDLEVALHEGAAAEWPTVARAVLGEEARLERLLDDLLVLAAADESATPRPGPPVPAVDLAALVADDAARARRVPVHVRRTAGDGDGDGGVWVPGTGEHQLARVVANLVDNAARHARSTVEVGVGPGPAGTVRLVVDDDGPGIPAADRERVFERFTRLDEARTRNDGGAGLGLAVVRSVVTRHRGRVWVEDAPLGGARLVVELPGVTTSAR